MVLTAFALLVGVHLWMLAQLALASEPGGTLTLLLIGAALFGLCAFALAWGGLTRGHGAALIGALGALALYSAATLVIDLFPDSDSAALNNDPLPRVASYLVLLWILALAGLAVRRHGPAGRELFLSSEGERIMSGNHNQDGSPVPPTNQGAKDGAGALPDDPKPVASRKVDASVEMTFPSSDPASTTTQAGLRVETDALRQPIAASMSLHRMVSAGLQAAYASESAMLARLQQVSATSPALQDSLDGLRAEGERQLERLQRSLAVFGVSADRGVPGTAPPGLEAGPLGDLALAFGLRVEGHRALGTYEALEQVASSTGMTDVVQYMQESVAAKQQTLDELARLCGDGLIEAAVRAGGDALPDPVLHQVFGA